METPTPGQQDLYSFKKNLGKAHRELQAVTNITAEELGMHHTNTVRDSMAGLHKVLL